MWTLVQKRRIRKDVKVNWRNDALGAQQEKVGNDVRGDQKKDDGSRKGEAIIVQCSSSTDDLHPQNWSKWRRGTTTAILSLLVFTQAWAGAAESMAHNQAKAEYVVCNVAVNLTTAVYLFGIGSGCLLVGPLSETGGRIPVYLSFSFAYLFFVLGSALSSTFVSQIVCRYFVGLASSAALGINGASIGDMFRPVERAGWFPVIAWVNVVRKYFCIPPPSKCK